VLNEEDKPMVELAYNHIRPLKRRTVKLGKEWEDLEQRVKNKLAQLGEQKTSKVELKRRVARPEA
jgi:hypothetical protein